MIEHTERSWIDGHWQAPVGASEFVGPPEGPAQAEGPVWPRADVESLELALAAAERATRNWATTPASERRARLSTAVAALTERRSDLRNRFASSVGLPVELARPWRVVPSTQLDGLLSGWGAGLEDDGGPPVFFVADWREGVGGLALRVFRALLDGRPVIVLGDPRLPRAAAALASALAAAELPPGTAAVLYDDGLTVLRGAATRVGLWSALEGNDRVLDALEAVTVEEPAIDWVTARRRTAIVRAADDPAQRARALFEKALGRSSTLTGQLPGQVGRVLCHELVLSSFTEALLAAYDDEYRNEPPVPQIDTRALNQARATWALGLDEGACLVRGAEPWTSAERGDRDAYLPAVFTNVDAQLRFARLQRPFPVLALVRVAADTQAERLRRELDHDETERHGRLPI